MSPLAAFLAGALIAGAICFIIMGRMVTVWYDKHRKAEATIFKLREHIEDLKQQKSPVYQVGVGVDPRVVRNRPDVMPRRVPTRPPGETIMIDVDDIPEWGNDG